MPSPLLRTQLAPEALSPPKSFPTLQRYVADPVRSPGPEFLWFGSHALLRVWDCVDLRDAPGQESAWRLSAPLRSHGRAHTQWWRAMGWPDFMAWLRALPGRT